MTSDSYRNAVLTVIAACLLWLAFGGSVPAVEAQAQTSRVIVAGWERPLPVIVVDDQGRPLSGAEGLRVDFGAAAMPVMIGNQPILVDVVKSPSTLTPQP
jgi:hypothetical protein